MTKTALLALLLLNASALSAQMAGRYDVVITEIMADPAPPVGLPNAEYIEIKNVSSTAFNLAGWRLSDATSTATINASFVLQPDSAVVLCATSQGAALSAFGRAIGVPSFPSLDNDGDVLTLRSPQGRTIHTVAYATNWYANEAKKDGGWSLEMIDPKNPCTGKENWKASTNNLGGTPGRTNAVNAANPDGTPPQLKRTYTLDSVTLVALFNEPLDSASASVANRYSIDGIGVTTALALPPAFTSVQLKLASPLQPATVYSLTVNNVSDCKGNTVGAFNKAKLGLPQTPAIGDVVVNEILFNPRAPGSDYVELFNRSKKTVDASKLFLGNRNGSGAVASLKRLHEEPFYLFPDDYLVATEDGGVLQQQYLVKNEDAVVVLSSLPSYPDDKGAVVLVHLNGDVIDEMRYEDDWHFGLITDKEGVALERIDPNKPSQSKANWHSASSTSGYGTPGYQNSQYKQTADANAAVSITPNIFSPDNDGRDDLLTISYNVEAQGYVANVIVFDAAGRPVRHLVKNDLLQLKGSWTWDGLGENRKRLPVGSYVVVTEVFNLQGKRKRFKNVVVLARLLD